MCVFVSIMQVRGEGLFSLQPSMPFFRCRMALSLLRRELPW
jgi:hypothetical protein